MFTPLIQENAETYSQPQNGNGSHPMPERLLSPPRWWQRFIPSSEVLIVGGRTIERGVVVTPAMGLTIILAFGSVLGVMYNSLSGQVTAKDAAYTEQRDMLVEIRTELRMTKEHDAEARAELKRQIGDLSAWQQVTNRDLARVIPARAKIKGETQQ